MKRWKSKNKRSSVIGYADSDPPDATFVIFLYAISKLETVQEKPCPSRRPAELSAGLKFNPCDIAPRLVHTAVSRVEERYAGRLNFLSGDI